MNYEILKFKNSKEWIDFENYYNRTNFIRQIGFYRYEDVHTNFLASVLEEENVYALGSYPLKLLIELLACKNSKLFNELGLLGNDSISDIKVSTQKVITSGRLDLFVEFKINSKQYALVLEAKLSSLEYDEQCKRYKEELDESLKNSHQLIYAYLSLDDKDQVSDDGYIHITYQDLIDMIYTPCSLKTQNKNMALSIEEYVKSFSCLYEENIIDNTLIPITYVGKELTIKVWKKFEKTLIALLNDKELLAQFYNNNKAIFTIFLTNVVKMSEELQLDDNLKVNISLVLSKTRHQNVFNNTILGNSDFLYTVFKDIIARKHILLFTDLPEDILHTTGTWENLIADSEIKNNPRKDYYRLTKNNNEPITINGKQYWYCDWNTGEDIGRFIDAVIKCYPEYKGKIYRLDKVDFQSAYDK